MAKALDKKERKEGGDVDATSEGKNGEGQAKSLNEDEGWGVLDEDDEEKFLTSEGEEEDETSDQESGTGEGWNLANFQKQGWGDLLSRRRLHRFRWIDLNVFAAC